MNNILKLNNYQFYGTFPGSVNIVFSKHQTIINEVKEKKNIYKIVPVEAIIYFYCSFFKNNQ
jgi:hypothetical protein